MPLVALCRLAFASPSGVSPLSLPHTLTRWLILLKARRQGTKPLRPVVSTRFQVLFHSPRRGSFHLSLTVLLRYRSSNVFSLGPWAALLPTTLACVVVLGILLRIARHVYRTLTVFGWPSHAIRLRLQSLTGVPQPRQALPAGLGCSAFARHYSQNHLFSSPYLDVSVQAVPFLR